jgi:hypothetical protein
LPKNLQFAPFVDVSRTCSDCTLMLEIPYIKFNLK